MAYFLSTLRGWWVNVSVLHIADSVDPDSGLCGVLQGYDAVERPTEAGAPAHLGDSAAAFDALNGAGRAEKLAYGRGFHVHHLQVTFSCHQKKRS